jgi:diguanylate cyclase (GGDEF)-like protein
VDVTVRYRRVELFAAIADGTGLSWRSAQMKPLTAGVGVDRAKPSRVGSSPARQRFAIAGLALALTAGLGAPSLAETLGVRVEAALVVVLAAGFIALGWFLGKRVDALTEQSLEDPITRVGNRRHWDERLAEEVDRAVRSRMPLSVLLVDVDNLKRLNDEHGHGAGDRALSIVGDVLLATCRSRDVAARFGGDEFALLLPRTRASEAKVVAERLRSELRRMSELAGAPLDSLLSVSVGVADLESVREPRTDLLFEAADQALYTAKQGGRDRVEVKPPLCISGVIRLDERRKGRASA